MASLVHSILYKPTLISKTNLLTFYTALRNSSKLPKKKNVRGTIKHRHLISSTCESLSARGFLRFQKAYDPPADIENKIENICKKVLGPDYQANSDLSRKEKFALLNTCFQELSHCVPNSSLHKINKVKEIIEFYKIPVSVLNPLDNMRNQELPPNLHIQYNYVRFHPDTDNRFKGISAFPGWSNIVTGLKAKTKYKGFKAGPLYKSPFAKESPFKV